VDRARFDRSEAEWTAVRERVRTILKSETAVTFVAEDDHRLIGEVLGVPRPSGALGIGVAVVVERRRQGIATALFAAVIVWAREAGVRELELDVQEVNEPARALYEKLGFLDTGRRRQGERGSVATLAKSL
jgi:RimJ/RimL family protein N-acetyltransferase